MLDLLPFANALTAAHPTDGCSLMWHSRPMPARVAGRRDPETGTTRVVILDDGREPQPLVPGRWLRLGPTGRAHRHDWGHNGPGARLLAFELLAEQLGPAVARRLRRPFLDEVARWPDHWALCSIDLTDWALRNGGLS